MNPTPFLVLILASVTFFAAVQDAKPCNPCEFRVAQSVAQNLQISSVEPTYPSEIRSSGISGTVSVAYVIDKDGNAVRPICARGESDPPLNPEICSAAMAAVTKWKYRPYLLNGEPKEVETIAVLSFNFAQAPSPLPIPDSPQKPKRLRVSQGVAEGNLIHRAPISYPLEAKEKRIQGDVILKVLIDRSGTIASAEQVQGDPVLGKTALEGVTQWKYRPYLLNGEPVEVETTVKVRFHL